MKIRFKNSRIIDVNLGLFYTWIQSINFDHSKWKNVNMVKVHGEMTPLLTPQGWRKSSLLGRAWSI